VCNQHKNEALLLHLLLLLLPLLQMHPRACVAFEVAQM
jgi:hypothetical protein